jgi:hypothetical protein
MRGDLLRALAAKGVEINGTIPTNVIGTALWSAREIFVNLRTVGYWLKDMPYAPAGYDPETWDAKKNEALSKISTPIRNPRASRRRESK